jgi:hypothetical protein
MTAALAAELDSIERCVRLLVPDDSLFWILETTVARRQLLQWKNARSKVAELWREYGEGILV